MSQSMLAVEFEAHKIDSIFADLDQCHLPGAAVGIAFQGRPVYRKGFGLASMEMPLVLTPSTRMRIGSTTKHFAALAYMLLCEDGKAGVDDPLGKYLPEIHPTARRVTMRHLMGNTSGLHNVPDLIHQFSDTVEAVTSADVVSCYTNLDQVIAEPGSSWIYNNGGWVLLSAAIERISGQSLEEFLWKRILEPVGMIDSRVRRWDNDFVHNSATAHMFDTTGIPRKMHYVYGVDYAGAGAMVSTVDDMLRWLAHMEEPRVGSTATWTLMKTAQTLPNGASTGYGLGLITSHYRGVETLSHSGGGSGSNAQMLKVPAAGLDVTVLVNRQDVSGIVLVNQILDACLPGLEALKQPSRSHPATGVFRSPRTGRVVQLFAKEEQQIASIDGVDMPVEPDEQGVLWPAAVYAFWKQGVRRVGNPHTPESILLHDFGNVEELLRVTPAANGDVATIAGRYRSEATQTDAVISETEHGPRMHTVGWFGSALHSLEYLAEGIWRTRHRNTLLLPPTGVLSFDETCGTFRFFNATSRSLTFRRVG